MPKIHVLKNITPCWCTFKTGGVMNEKYPGGVKGEKFRLEREEHMVIKKEKKYLVVLHEKALLNLNHI